MTAWARYIVGKPSARRNFTEPTCMPFSTVLHVAHVDTALDIIRDGAVRPSLVFDRSVLNDSRILVAWASPNHWVRGFRYGNIGFLYDFAKLVAGRNYYWVEVIEYQPAACRILVTSIDRSAALTPYDPSRREGPWWFDKETQTHFFNGKYCIEFMFEHELAVRDLVSLTFERHHNEFCSARTPAKCPNLGLDAASGGALFLAKAGAAALDLTSIASIWTSKGKLASHLQSVLQCVLRSALRRVVYSGRVKASKPSAVPLARAVLNANAIGRNDEARLLAKRFQSERDLYEAVATILTECLGLDDEDLVFRNLTAD